MLHSINEFKVIFLPIFGPDSKMLLIPLTLLDGFSYSESSRT